MCDPNVASQGMKTANNAFAAYNNAGAARSSARLSALQQEGNSANKASQGRMRAAGEDLASFMAALNAQGAESDAKTALLSGAREVQKSKLSTAQVKSKQRVAMAANGIDLGVGTAENVQTSTDVIGEIDAVTIEANASRAAWGHRMRGAAFEGESILHGVSAESIRGQVDVSSRIDARTIQTNREIANAISPNRALFNSLLQDSGDMYSSIDAMNRREKQNANKQPDDPIYDYGKRRKWWGN